MFIFLRSGGARATITTYRHADAPLITHYLLLEAIHSHIFWLTVQFAGVKSVTELIFVLSILVLTSSLKAYIHDQCPS